MSTVHVNMCLSLSFTLFISLSVRACVRLSPSHSVNSLSHFSSSHLKCCTSDPLLHTNTHTHPPGPFLQNLDVFFLETPLRMDMVREMAELRGAMLTPEYGGTRIAYGEWQATRFEMAELMDVGEIDVAQPDVGRIGGYVALFLQRPPTSSNATIAPRASAAGHA